LRRMHWLTFQYRLKAWMCSQFLEAWTHRLRGEVLDELGVVLELLPGPLVDLSDLRLFFGRKLLVLHVLVDWTEIEWQHLLHMVVVRPLLGVVLFPIGLIGFQWRDVEDFTVLVVLGKLLISSILLG
jgi:hypothetical protein